MKNITQQVGAFKYTKQLKKANSNCNIFGFKGNKMINRK